MPEMGAAVSKLMRNQGLIGVARRAQVTSEFRNTLGLPGRLATRLQPNLWGSESHRCRWD